MGKERILKLQDPVYIYHKKRDTVRIRAFSSRGTPYEIEISGIKPYDVMCITHAARGLMDYFKGMIRQAEEEANDAWEGY